VAFFEESLQAQRNAPLICATPTQTQKQHQSIIMHSWRKLTQSQQRGAWFIMERLHCAFIARRSKSDGFVRPRKGAEDIAALRTILRLTEKGALKHALTQKPPIEFFKLSCLVGKMSSSAQSCNPAKSREVALQSAMLTHMTKK